ncbi:glycosyltransferase family 4 protein [bacterium]|nr:MAG: glycosyltransferase family 4 protein [bacterium]
MQLLNQRAVRPQQSGGRRRTRADDLLRRRRDRRADRRRRERIGRSRRRRGRVGACHAGFRARRAAALCSRPGGAGSAAALRRTLACRQRRGDPAPSRRVRRPIPRVAIVSDPLVQRGGAERVVQTIAELYPEAPVFTLLYSERSGPRELRQRIIPSWLAAIPGAARRHRWLLPLYPAAVESFDLRGYDVIISSHHTAAKGLLRSAGQVHICYCHTPMRALWERPHEELATLAAPLRPAAALLMQRLRVWDAACAQRVDHFVANSETTRRRIAKHYGRESAVIPPPIDVSRFTPGGSVGDYYLVASRPVPYKRIDLAVAAAARLGRRLVIAGGAGSSFAREPHVEALGHVSDDELVTLMRGCRALLFPQLEDFGMAPLEAMACGRPVVAYGRGGALETVIHRRTGILVDEQSVDAFTEGIRQVEHLAIDPAALRRHAERFSVENFAARLRALVDAAWMEILEHHVTSEVTRVNAAR